MLVEGVAPGVVIAQLPGLPLVRLVPEIPHQHGGVVRIAPRLVAVDALAAVVGLEEAAEPVAHGAVHLDGHVVLVAAAVPRPELDCVEADLLELLVAVRGRMVDAEREERLAVYQEGAVLV